MWHSTFNYLRIECKWSNVLKSWVLKSLLRHLYDNWPLKVILLLQNSGWKLKLCRNKDLKAHISWPGILSTLVKPSLMWIPLSTLIDDSCGVMMKNLASCQLKRIYRRRTQLQIAWLATLEVGIHFLMHDINRVSHSILFCWYWIYLVSFWVVNSLILLNKNKINKQI